MYKYTSQKNEKDSKAENKVNNRDKSDFPINNSICQKLNFRMQLKYGLKAQKLLAQGSALGIIAISKAPCKGKSLMLCLEF